MIKVIAMDMDGTITQHKSALEKQNRETIKRLREKYRVVIIGAGTCKRIDAQLKLSDIDIIGSYGMQSASVVDNQFILMENTQMEVDHKSIEERVKYLRKRFQYQVFDGEGVEFHETGMVTIPLLGTKARLNEKLIFDPKREKRRKIYHEVVNLFPEYTVFIGGTSSFDLAPMPYNKRYALFEYAQMHHFSHDEIIYIGDDYGVGGNDEQLYHSDIHFLKIDAYKDFPVIVAGLL